MNRYQKRATIYELSALCGMTIKLLDQKQAGKISDDEFREKLREIEEHRTALRAKYPREL